MVVIHNPAGEHLPHFAEAENIGSNKDWYALRVCARREKWTAAALKAKEYEVCLPLHLSSRRWSDRRKIIKVPVFPGYIFCAFDVNRRTPILETPGVMAVLQTGKKPTPLQPEELQALKVLERSQARMEPWPFLKVGDWVVIAGGPLDGLIGVLQAARKVTRVVVSVTLLHRAVAVEVPRESVKPISPPKLGPMRSRQFSSADARVSFQRLSRP